MGNFGLKLCTFFASIYPIFTCLDLNPYSDYGSGSTKVLITSPIWIRIHNTLVVGIFFHVDVVQSSTLAAAITVMLVQDIASKEDCSMPARLAGRIAEKSGRNLRRAVLLAESCRVQQPTLQPNQDIQASF